MTDRQHRALPPVRQVPDPHRTVHAQRAPARRVVHDGETVVRDRTVVAFEHRQRDAGLGVADTGRPAVTEVSCSKATSYAVRERRASSSVSASAPPSSPTWTGSTATWPPALRPASASRCPANPRRTTTAAARPRSERGAVVELLAPTDGYAVHFVAEAYKHAKPVAAFGAGVDLLRVAGVAADVAKNDETVVDAGVVTSGRAPDAGCTERFADLIAGHRVWRHRRPRTSTDHRVSLDVAR
jgi:long catalase-like protein